MMHVWLIGLREHFGEIVGKSNVRPLFLLYGFFLFSRNPAKRFWGLIFWSGRARHPGPPSQPRHVSLEFHNVGGWLTHGDVALG